GFQRSLREGARSMGHSFDKLAHLFLEAGDVPCGGMLYQRLRGKRSALKGADRFYQRIRGLFVEKKSGRRALGSAPSGNHRLFYAASPIAKDRRPSCVRLERNQAVFQKGGEDHPFCLPVFACERLVGDGSQKRDI